MAGGDARATDSTARTRCPDGLNEASKALVSGGCAGISDAVAQFDYLLAQPEPRVPDHRDRVFAVRSLCNS
jgi:hypothetical protein